jgi:hypothetical protein
MIWYSVELRSRQSHRVIAILRSKVYPGKVTSAKNDVMTKWGGPVCCLRCTRDAVSFFYDEPCWKFITACFFFFFFFNINNIIIGSTYTNVVAVAGLGLPRF